MTATDGTPDDLDDVEDLVNEACDEGDPTDLIELAKRRPHLIRPFHRRLIDADIWGPELYRGMDEPTAEYIVQLVEADAGQPGSLLIHLASGNTATAWEAIRRWDSNPPAWAADWYVPIRYYSVYGGWEFGEAGEVRQLTSTAAFALVADGPADAVVSGGTLPSRCPWCDLQLWRLLDADLSTGILPGLGDAGRVCAGTCLRCNHYVTIFTEYDGAGSCSWADENQRPGRSRMDELPLPTTAGLHIGPPRPTPFSGSASDRGGSTLGGMPEWIQDPDYPACRRCGRTMLYLGMITDEDLWGGDTAMGCHYVFADERCRLAAVVYQVS